jgi:hypothetical protein
MDGNITNEITRVCQILNKKNVEYLIIGGTAVAFHGYFRWSKNSDGKLADKFDLDIWYNPTYNNYFKLLSALAELEQDVSKFIKEKAPNPRKSYFRFDTNKFTLDLLPMLKDNSIDELLQDKASNSRPKDLEDINQLKAIKKK